jgi:xylulose-5-phosphate/fructose-6-phosphate phosphoketolase
MAVLNDMDRFHLVMDVADRVPEAAPKAADVKQRLRDKRAEHREYSVRHGEDLPEVRGWAWRP